MKKLFLLLSALFCFILNINAQEAESQETKALKQSVGMIGSVQFDSGYNNFGLGAKYQYSFTERIRAEVNGSYFFKKDYLTEWDINLNAHYLVPLVVQGLKCYPIAGVGLLGMHWELISYSDVKLCGNVGAGLEYPLYDFLTLNAEYKMRYSNNGSRGVVALGVAYKF